MFGASLVLVRPFTLPKARESVAASVQASLVC